MAPPSRRQSNVKEPARLFREGAAPGDWCCLLVTILLFATCHGHGQGDCRPLTMILTTTFVVTSIFWANKLIHRQSSISGAVSRLLQSPFTQAAAPDIKVADVNVQVIKGEKSILLMAIVTAFFVWYLTGAYYVAPAVIMFFAYCNLLPLLFTTFPASFTFGEGCLVLQSILVYVHHSVLALVYSEDRVATVAGSFAAISRICLLSVIVMLALPMNKMSSCFGSPTFFFAYGTFFFMAVTYPLLWSVLKRNPFTWMFNYVTGATTSLLPFLILLWGALVATALTTVQQQTTKANTRTRKIFHVLVVAVQVSGCVVDVHFTSLASQLVLGVFIILEYIRVTKIEPFASALDAAFALFVDEKDRGALVLTNIYLLVGTFSPIWIASEAQLHSRHLAIFSGVLSVGVGDAVASVAGSKYGVTKWPGSNKTYLGTGASIVAQMTFVGLWAAPYGDLDLEKTLLVTVSIAVTSVMEAVTEQVDNVVLPLNLFIMLSLH